MHKTLRAAVALSVAASLTLSACRGDDKDSGSAEPTTTTGTPSPSSTVDVPAGVTLTEPGTSLAFGDSATVEYSPTQSLSGVLSLKVKNARQGTLADLKGFDIDDAYRRNANYYYVNVEVENVGDGNLGGRDVPLDGVNQENTLLPPVVFVSAFKKCPSQKLPKRFGKGAEFETCLVFLSPNHGKLTAVSFKTDDSTEAVTWAGEVAKPAKKPRKKS